MRRTLALACALALPACHAGGARLRALPPLGREGEVFVYLEPLEREATRLGFTLTALAAERGDAPALPLEVMLREVRGAELGRQRLLGWARLPPGDYPGLLLTVSRATLAGDEGGGPSDLLVPSEPLHVPVPLQVRAGEAVVLSLNLQFAASVQKGFAFAPSFRAAVTIAALTQLGCYAPSRTLADVAVIDRHTRRAMAVLPVGYAPEGIALDPARQRMYVALAGEDQIQILDLQTGTELNRVMLRAGDGPRELRLTDDGRLLLSANPGSNTLVFIDPGPGLEVGRVNLGEEPSAITLDRSGRRAYVVIHRASQVAIVDLASLAVVGSLGTEALPTRVQLDRSSRRLYVAQAGSPYLAVYRLPALTLDRRVFVGLGASALKVDPRTDLVYVAKEDEGTIQVFDPLSFIPLASIELPGGVAYLTIDDAENTLVALLRERREVAFVDLASRRLLGATDVGADPAFVALLGERN